MPIRTFAAGRRSRLRRIRRGGALAMAMGLVAVAIPGVAHAMPASSVLYVWGQDYEGQLGDGGTATHNSPEAITLAPGVAPTVVADGGDSSLAIGSDDRLYAWGDNEYGQLGDGTQTQRDRPVVVTLAAGVDPTAISASADEGEVSYSLAIGSDHRLYAWGDNTYGELGLGTTAGHDSPQVVTLAAGVGPTAIAAGYGFALAIGSDHKLYAWGINSGGELGDGTTTQHETPEAITLAAGVTPTAVSVNTGPASAIGSDGKLYTWGNAGVAAVPAPVTLPPGVMATAVADGGDHFLVIGSDHRLYAWGANYNGDLGDGTQNPHVTPEVITLAAGVTPSSVAATPSMSLATGSDHRVYTWGYSAGDGGFTPFTPQRLNIVNASAVATGFNHDLAIGTALLPVVTAVSPKSGPTAGGTQVTVSGDDFTGATSVRFGTVAATSFHIVSATEITAVSPPQPDSVHNVYVTTPSGMNAAEPADEYAYGADVAGISPTIGTTSGGTTVTLTGAGFTGATSVSFGTVPAASFEVVSATEITAVSPAQAAGGHNITVTTPTGTTPAVTADVFTYAVIVSTIWPTFGTARGGQRIAITGSDLSGATRVLFGTVPAASIHVVSDTDITALSPAQPVGPHNVYVTTPAGTSAPVAGDVFTYEVVVSAISPNSGPTTGGTTVTITGSDFTGATQVLFGDLRAANFHVLSDTEITAVSPSDPDDPVPAHNITVDTPAGISTETYADLFTFTYEQPSRSGHHQRTEVGFQFSGRSASRAEGQELTSTS